MSMQSELMRVDPSTIALNQPLDFTVVTAQGALLAAQGARILDEHKLAILKEQGWRQPDGTGQTSEPRPANAAVEPIQIGAQLAPRPPAPLSEATALIADDMAMSRTLLTRSLTEQGVRWVIEAEDGKRAISRFFIDLPDLVFLDIDMPKIDGLGALRQIRAWSPDVFVCLVSANSTRVNVQAAREYRVDGFLVKPFTILNLKRVMAKYEARLQAQES